MDSEDSKGAVNPIFELMARRDRERKLVNEKNQRSRQNKSELEGIDYFESIFDRKVCEIESRLDAMQPTNDPVELQEEFTAVGKDLQELQKYFTSSTIFLHDHKIKTCQNMINQLITKCDDAKARLLPKKKFGFKNKAVKSSKVETEPKVEEAIKETTRKEFLWTRSQKTHERVLIENDQVNDQDLTFKEMENCVIEINGHPGSLQMLKMKNCLVLCGPISRSAFADFCENCTFVFDCQQLRLHSSENCNIYIRVTSRGIIEDCKNIQFAPSTYSYENYETDLKHSGLDTSTNNWEDIGDFNWLSTEQQSPNWNRINEDDRIIDWKEFCDEFIKKHQISN